MCEYGASQKSRQNIDWLKSKIRTIAMAPKYCGLCLATFGNFYQLRSEFAINECYSTRPLREVVNAILNCDIEDYVSSEIICEDCTEKTIQSYVFIENTKKIFNILNYCVNDLLSKATDLDDELDEYCDYENSNVMIVVECDDQTNRSVDEITTGNTTVLTNTPMKGKEQSVRRPQVEKKPLPIMKLSKENQQPVIIPTIRVVKHPRTEEVNKEEKLVVPDTPTVSLEGGKIVIAPMTTNTQSAPKFNTYKCSSCMGIFTTYRSLKEHEKSVHNTTVFQCRCCNKKYNSQQYLDVHYTAAHLKSRCRHCHELFDCNDLNNHLREKHEKKVNACKYCDLVYYTLEQLETHLKSVHRVSDLQYNKNKTQCVMCLRYFRDCEIKKHKCKFSCLDCAIVPCIHYSYLMSYREQVLSHTSKIRCIDCDYTTKRKEHLIAHVNREHLDYHPFDCSDCGTQFYTKLSLRSHIVQFHQDMKCEYCDHEFKNSKHLQNHKELCKTVTRTFSCDKCVASFDTEPELNKHAKSSHSEIVFPCTLCKKEFTNESSLEEHHARVHNGIQYKKRRRFIECTLCDITFRNIKEMLQHENLHDPNEGYPCRVCSKTFPSLKKVYMHKQKHYSQRIKCPGCNKFLAASYFIQHKAICSYLKQSQNKPYVCSVCGKTFRVESSLYTHQLLHSKSTQCEYCNRLIKPSSMKKHIETKHMNDQDKEKQFFKCDHCNYSTRKKVDFENHVNKIHLKIKPYVCEVCNKAFCGKSRLDEHVKTHSDNNVCFCSYCGKKFANKVCLKMHTRRHTGEKPYECNICSEQFRSSSIMKTHRLKRHQDKTVECPICGYMYHLVAEMRFHVKKIHWKSEEPFDYKQLVGKEYYHLFEDRRLQKLGGDNYLPKAEE